MKTVATLLRTSTSVPRLVSLRRLPTQVATFKPVSFHTVHVRSYNTQTARQEEEKPAEQTEQTQEPEQPEDPKDAKIKELEKRLGEFEKMVDELRAGWKGALAEQDNVRKRAQKEIEKAKDFGVEKLCKHLFNVNDTINIILQNQPDFDLPENQNNIHAKSAFEGIQRVKQQFASAFADSYEIEEFQPELGEMFDPLQHNALFEVDPPKGKDIGPGKVGLLVKSGWKRKGSLLRPASVGVVKAAPSDS